MTKTSQDKSLNILSPKRVFKVKARKSFSSFFNESAFIVANKTFFLKDGSPTLNVCIGNRQKNLIDSDCEILLFIFNLGKIKRMSS